MSYCNHCGHKLVENARFCSFCGTQTSLKNKIAGIRKRLQFKAQNTIENFKDSLDDQISKYLQKLEGNKTVRIAGIKIPDNRRKGVKSAMMAFQNRYLEGEPNNSKDYDDWIENLPERLEEHNCVVCFTKWDTTNLQDIVVCPKCHTGGHKDHLRNWIKTQNHCPLCRAEVSFSEYIQII